MAAAFATDDDDFYPMNARRKGICLIINNFQFVRSTYLDTGFADKENLRNTFNDLDFDVRYFENQTCAEMKTQMENIQEELESHSNYDCFVCCISSHGNETGVGGADDQTVNVSELQEYVFSTKCPSLAEKPKVFFVNACRGGEKLEAVLHGGGTAPVERWITDKSDFLLSFAATKDNPAYTNADPKKGSVYVQHLTRLLNELGKRKMVTQILHKLNAELKKDPLGKKVLQTAEYVSTLEKDLCFYDPAVGASLRGGAPDDNRTEIQFFCFHANHGNNVELSNEMQTATFLGSNADDGGIVMSHDPMEVNKLYKIIITKSDPQRFALWMGVVTSSPDSLTVPGVAFGWKKALVVDNGGVSDHGKKVSYIH
ncbi:caspase-7-like [Littorina saxatilis]|uniref:caspase-7-like n=1 Tax=Littorina saxatilis TaxID=31220 RepID=UPI0038B532FC